MRLRSLFRTRCRTNREFNDLPKVGSQITSITAKSAACGLVFSSMGFGGLFAWQSSISHGVPMALLTVLFAVALETCKPLAVAGAFAAFRDWAVVRGLALTALATVAIVYSLTAELTLLAGSRGDLVAKREAAIESRDDQRQRVKDARAELATLAPSRTIEEAKADIVKLLAAYPKAGDCRSPIANATARYVCPKVTALEGEAARAKRRAELQAVMDRNAEGKATTPAVKTADPGSAALATYLGTLGFNVSATVLTDYLVLIPVLALEIGAALAVLLVQSVSGGHRSVQSTGEPPQAQPAPPIGKAVDSQRRVTPPGPPRPRDPTVDANSHVPRPRRKDARTATERLANRRLGPATTLTKADAQAKVVDALRRQGGRMEGASVRGLARLIGARKSTVHNAIAALITAGTVARLGGELVLRT